MSYSKMFLCFLIVLNMLFLLTGCFGVNRRTTGNERFFLEEEGVEDYGKKTFVDRVYQLDPGDKEFTVSDKFYKNPPMKIAILPFDNKVGGKYILNEIPIPRFGDNKEEGWNWTYANRVRRLFFGHFTAREFQDIDLRFIDKVLQKLEILTPNDLNSFPPQELGRILDADALIYGNITDYKNSYYALVAQIRIGLHIKCVSVEDGTVLFEGEQKRYDNNVLVATNPFDFVIAAFQNYMRLRDVFAARASEEVARELVLRIPVVKSFIDEEEMRIDEKVRTRLSDSTHLAGKELSENKIISVDNPSIEGTLTQQQSSLLKSREFQKSVN